MAAVPRATFPLSVSTGCGCRLANLHAAFLRWSRNECTYRSAKGRLAEAGSAFVEQRIQRRRQAQFVQRRGIRFVGKAARRSERQRQQHRAASTVVDRNRYLAREPLQRALTSNRCHRRGSEKSPCIERRSWSSERFELRSRPSEQSSPFHFSFPTAAIDPPQTSRQVRPIRSHDPFCALYPLRPACPGLVTSGPHFLRCH